LLTCAEDAVLKCYRVDGSAYIVYIDKRIQYKISKFQLFSKGVFVTYDYTISNAFDTRLLVQKLEQYSANKNKIKQLLTETLDSPDCIIDMVGKYAV
jgi:hypothetical protein